MTNVLSCFAFILLANFYKNNTSFFIKNVKNCPNNFVIHFCLIYSKLDDFLLKAMFEQAFSNIEEVKVLPTKLIKIEVKTPTEL